MFHVENCVKCKTFTSFTSVPQLIMAIMCPHLQRGNGCSLCNHTDYQLLHFQTYRLIGPRHDSRYDALFLSRSSPEITIETVTD